MGHEGGHIHSRQRIIHPAADLLRRHSQIFRGKGHILLHHVGDDLVVRVLEHHAHPAANLQQARLVLRVHALHIHLASAGQQNGVQAFGKGGFARTVMAQHHHKASFFNGRVHTPQGQNRLRPFLRRIGEFQSLCFSHGWHDILQYVKIPSAAGCPRSWHSAFP